jgi:hypothetical protein
MDRLTVITSSIKHDNVDVQLYGLQHLSCLLQTEKGLFQACIGEKDHVDPIIREVKYYCRTILVLIRCYMLCVL